MTDVKNLLTKSEVQDLVYKAGKDTEDVFEYLHGLEIIKNDETFYDRVDVIRYITR